MEATLEKAWKDSPDTARDLCGAMLTSETTTLQPLAAELICKHAPAEDLARAARGLSPSGFPDARRMLVRALGTKDKETAAKLAEEFLDDRDPMVRAAAILACADLGDTESLGTYIRRLQTPPAYVSSWDGGKDGVLEMAMQGAVRVLTGLRPTVVRDVTAWWGGERPEAKPFPDAAEELLSGTCRGQRYFSTPNFDVYLHVKGVEAPAMTGAVGADGQPNPLTWAVLTEALEGASASACKAAGPIFGPVRLPVIRALVCDDRQFAPHAGLSYMGGVSRGNEVVLRLQSALAMRATMTHEMIHVIQGASYEDEPRWLSEGLAESLSRSRERTIWSATRVRSAGLDDWIDHGGVSEAIGWSSGAASGEREARRYALAHLVVDFLRFGGWSAPSARLTYLLGAMDRGVPPAQAIEAIYGAKPRELDGRLRRWLGVKE
jgi:hypothetical protein